MIIGNDNLIHARLDPDRMVLVRKLKKKGETDTNLLRRAIDALAEKEKKL